MSRKDWEAVMIMATVVFSACIAVLFVVLVPAGFMWSKASIVERLMVAEIVATIVVSFALFLIAGIRAMDSKQ